jgi:DNA replicative helicase MCM subunit Mcm2 (Cdc46/Mcm family)
MHVMIDDPDDIMDYRIASHIVAVHQRQDQAFDVPYTMTDIQLYLKYARAHKPELTAAVSGSPCIRKPDSRRPQAQAICHTPWLLS